MAALSRPSAKAASLAWNLLRQGDVPAVAAIAVGVTLAFGGLLAAPVGAGFGEATPFYGTPLLIAREAIVDHGAAPIWNARTGAGEPLLANPLATQFYPLSIIGMLSANPALDGVRWMAFAHLLGGALAIYAFARIIGARPVAALLAPTLFVLNAHTGWRVSNGFNGQIYALVWLPTAATLAVLTLRRQSLMFSALTGIALAMMVLAGTVYDAYFAGLAVAVLFLAWTLQQLVGQPWRVAAREIGLTAGLAAAALVTMLAVSAVKTIPVAAFQPFSTRVGFSLQEAEVGLENIPTYTQHASLVLEQVPTSVISGVHVLVVVFAGLGVLHRRYEVAPLVAMAVIGLWASLGMRAPADLYAFFHGVLPGFAFNNTTLRFMNLFYFAFAALAAVGLGVLLAQARRALSVRRYRLDTLIGATAVVLVGVAAIVPMRDRVDGAVTADAYAPEPTPGSAHAILADLQIREGEHAFRTFSTHVFALDSGRVTPASSAMYHVDTANPINTHMVPTYQLMTDYSPDAETFRRQSVLAAVLNARYFVYEADYDLGPPEGSGAPIAIEGGAIYPHLRALDRAQVVPTSILVIGNDLDQDFNAAEARLLVFIPQFDPRATAILHGRSGYVDDYRPSELAAFDAVVLTDWRARDGRAAGELLDAYSAAGGRIVYLDQLTRPESNPFKRSMALLRNDDPPKRLTEDSQLAASALLRELSDLARSRAVPQVSIEQYGPTEMRFRTGSNRHPATFLFSQMYFPGWTVEIDGAPAPLFMADSLVNGVVLPPGESHTLTFSYAPRAFHIGAGISLTALVVLLASATWTIRGRHRNAL